MHILYFSQISIDKALIVATFFFFGITDNFYNKYPRACWKAVKVNPQAELPEVGLLGQKICHFKR